MTRKERIEAALAKHDLYRSKRQEKTGFDKLSSSRL
jgi:hypothetical protein